MIVVYCHCGSFHDVVEVGLELGNLETMVACYPAVGVAEDAAPHGGGGIMEGRVSRDITDFADKGRREGLLKSDSKTKRGGFDNVRGCACEQHRTGGWERTMRGIAGYSKWHSQEEVIHILEPLVESGIQ